MPDSNDQPFTDAELTFLQAIAQSHTPFLVVGLAAAVLQGADAVTQDIDLWFKAIADPRIDGAARKAGGVFVWRTSPPMLSGPGLEKIDVVLRCQGLESFDREHRKALDVRLGSFTVKVLPLERIIASKEAANREKDRAVLPALRAALAATRTR